MGLRVVARYGGQDSPIAGIPATARARVLAQAPKRVGLRFTVTRAVTWDHRKLSMAPAETGGGAIDYR
jgi:hypothetical protein